MSVKSYIFAILAAVIVLFIVVEMLRRGRLRERHAVWWIFAGLLALVAGIFPVTLDWAAGLLGVEVPTNLVFFVSIAVVLLVCLQHSAELTKLESKARALAERVSMLDMRLRALEGVESSVAAAPPAARAAIAADAGGSTASADTVAVAAPVAAKKPATQKKAAAVKPATAKTTPAKAAKPKA